VRIPFRTHHNNLPMTQIGLSATIRNQLSVKQNLTFPCPHSASRSSNELISFSGSKLGIVQGATNSMKVNSPSVGKATTRSCSRFILNFQSCTLEAVSVRATFVSEVCQSREVSPQRFPVVPPNLVMTTTPFSQNLSLACSSVVASLAIPKG
jgi:hypothetical protein